MSQPARVLPETKLPDDTHIFHMTDDTGMFQHAKFTVPDPAYGYTTDDNARALIMATMLFETAGAKKYLDFVYTYMHFVLNARKGEGFRNFMDYNHNFREEKGSEDCFGRCLWGLGYVARSSRLPRGLRHAAVEILQVMSSQSYNLQSLRGRAYALLGLCYWNKAGNKLRRKLAWDLVRAFEENQDDGWKWFEERITYCNAIIPFALLKAYRVIPVKRWLDTGRESLDFLLGQTFRDGIFQPVGCKGWLEKGKKAAVYDQQPVEAGETLLACIEAYKVTGDKKYLGYAKACFDWYLGKNIAGVSLIDPDTGGCMDGITPHGPNENEGAESLISWFLAWLAWNKISHYAVETN